MRGEEGTQRGRGVGWVGAGLGRVEVECGWVSCWVLGYLYFHGNSAFLQCVFINRFGKGYESCR